MAVLSKVKVVVTCHRPGGYWCAGRQWGAGDTEAVLEDRADLPLHAQLAQLAAAKGGVPIVGAAFAQSSPPALSYRIVEDPPPVIEVPPPMDRIVAPAPVVVPEAPEAQREPEVDDGA